MMTIEQELGFWLASTICVLAPGPDNLSVLSLSMSKGKKAGIGFAIGCSLGCLLHTLLAVVGISALIASSEIAFRLLQYAGAAYLFYLGTRILQTSADSGNSETTPDHFSETAQAPFRLYLVRGLTANVLNPKVSLFFLAFLPQFVSQSNRIEIEIARLGFVFSGLTLLIFSSLGYFAGTLGDWLHKKAEVNLWFNRLTAGLFFGLAVNLLLSSR